MTTMTAKSILLLSLCILLFPLDGLNSGIFVSASTDSEQDESSGNEERKGRIVGIDLGTTYSCVGVFRNGQVDIISNDQGNRITPSYVAFADPSWERLVGDAAKNQATVHPSSTIFGVKRLIGRHYDDDSVQADKKMVPYEVSSDERGKPTIVVRLSSTGERRVFAPEEISAMVLQKMKLTAETFLGEDVERAVITVPAYFNDAQRHATKDAGRIAGLHVERIINEPTAAAIAYGIDKEGLGKETDSVDVDETIVLVYDLGGGTFDVTLLSVENGVFDVLATNGDTHLGGEDFDQRIMSHFISLIKKKHKVDIAKDKRAVQRLRKEAERVKRALSTQPQARLEIDDLVGAGVDFSETLTRARFEELNADLFKKTLDPINQVLEDAMMEPSEVHEIVMVGGSTRIPKIRSLVSERFGGKELQLSVNPDEAVAYGAALQGGIMSGDDTMEGNPVVLDVTPLSLGIETADGLMSVVIRRDTTIPTKSSSMFTTNEDDQEAIIFPVFQGERSVAKDNMKLGEFELSGIHTPAPKGHPEVKVTFEIDANGIIIVSAEDLGSGSSETITIASETGRLSSEQIDSMKAEAERYAEEDARVKERVEARNELESYLYNLRSTVQDDEDSSSSSVLSAKHRLDVNEVIDDAIDWLEENAKAEKAEIRKKKHEVESVAGPIMRKLYEEKKNNKGGDGNDNEDGEDFSGDDEL